MKAALTWFRTQFAEWFVGSWALLLGWGIVGTIFANLLIMDGHFSRTLGEGSGVDPALFQHIGWMFRLFAATFLVLCVRFEQARLTGTANKLKTLGAVCTVIVIAHAAGFGLTALEEKRASAVAVMGTATTAAASNAAVIKTLEEQRDAIQAAADRNIASLQSSIDRITGDGLDNDDQADPYRQDQATERDQARTAIAGLNAEIRALTLADAKARTAAVSEVTQAQSAKWSPLFVGLAQLFTFSKSPDDWAIYLSGVAFMMAWVLLADAIVIGVPPGLYKLHLADAKSRQAREAGSKGGKTTSARQREKLKAIAHYATTRGARPDLTEDTQPDAARDDPRAPRSADPDTDTEEDDDDGDHRTPRQAAE